ncbi:MAG TPA: hypothetical protein VGR14_21475 [Verrucomicrobiae bacterium]|nr:hypothetical protein [Verrucomicrobiae bacterium]
MKLHSPAFEKALRRGVKGAVRSSRELKKEFRKANKYRRRIRSAGFIRFCISFLSGAAVWSAAAMTGHPATGLLVIGLWSLALVFVSARNLLVTLFRANDLWTLFLLPVSEATIFRWELQRFFRGSRFVLSDLIVGFGALALFLELPPGKWILVPAIAALSWAVVLALAALCAARWPRFPYERVYASLVLSGFVIVMTVRLVGRLLITFLDSAAPALNLLLPTAWGPSLFQLSLPNGNWRTIVLLLPIGLVLYTARSSLALLRGKYQFHEVTIAEAPDLLPGGDAETASRDPEGIPSAPARAGLTVIEDFVQSRQFLSPEPWQQNGRLEKWLWQWFSPREKTLAEFAFPRGIAITRPWWIILRNFLWMLALGFTARFAGQQVENWVFGIGFFVIFSLAANQILGNGVAFQFRFNNGVNIPLYAGFPVGFRELSRVLFKCSFIQIPLLIPLTTLSGGLIAHLAGVGLSFGILPGLKAAFLISACRPMLVALAFSSGTNDTAGFHVRTLSLVVVIIGSGLCFLILGAGGLFLPNPWIAWVLWVLALLDAYIFFRVYGWFYHAYRFDLMKIQVR